MSDLDLPILVGGGALAAYVWSRSRKDNPTDELEHTIEAAPPEVAATPISRRLPGRWFWPVPLWRGRRPVISDGFGSPRPGGRRHEGVDLMYARAQGDSYRRGTPNGAAHHVMPDGMLALAAFDGAIWSAGWTSRGFTVVVDHTPFAPVATYYTHLERLLVSPTEHAKSGQRVRGGQPIGVIGVDPLDAEHLKHLHFALWRGGPRDAVDPEPLMKTWQYVADPRAPSPNEGALVALRNAGFRYRLIGSRGDPYPEWIRALRGKSGVYIIRERDADDEPVTVYVGESHTSNLYETLTRHFQEVRHEAQEDPMT